ncbi:MAG: hypothetical protein MI974_05645 [Chitinophagales bacterium]|nr:hypothetical protein [Chitinophagales bacterium]
MNDSKLLKFLKVLSTSELREFTVYLQNGPKEKKRALHLLKLLKKYHPEFDSKNVSKAYFHKKIYPEYKQERNFKRITDLMSSLLNDLNDFMVLKELDLQKETKNRILLQAYKRRKLDAFVIKEIEKIQSRLGQQEIKNGAYYEYQYWLAITKYDHPYSMRSSKEFHSSLIHLMESLDNYYYHHRMILVLELAHRRKTEDNSFAQFNNDWIIDAIKKLGSKASITLQLLIQLYEAITSEDYLKFDQLKRLIFKYIHSFSSYAKRSIYLVFKDYTAWCYYNQAISAGKVFDVIRFEIEEKLLINHESVSRRAFANAVTISCAAKEYTWAKQFVEKFNLYLKEEIRENVVSLSMANILFHQKEFKAAFDILAKVDFKSVGDKIIGRSLQLRIYYELKEFIALDAYIKATLQYIKRGTTFSQQYIDNYSLFVKAINDLMKLDAYTPKKLMNQFYAKYCATREIFYRDWILEKYQQIVISQKQ